MTSYEEEAARAAEVVRRGGVILYPTDTVWGIGCDAANAAAVRRVFDIKRRPEAKSLIVLVADSEALSRIVSQEPSAQLAALADDPARPTTVIYPGACNLAREVVADDGSVAVRITAEPFSAALCRACATPLVSTSANISGERPAALFSEISAEILDAVDYVVGVRRDETQRCAPSRIVKQNADGQIEILRP